MISTALHQLKPVCLLLLLRLLSSLLHLHLVGTLLRGCCLLLDSFLPDASRGVYSAWCAAAGSCRWHGWHKEVLLLLLSKDTNKQAGAVRPNDVCVMRCKKVGVPVHPWSPKPRAVVPGGSFRVKHQGPKA